MRASVVSGFVAVVVAGCSSAGEAPAGAPPPVVVSGADAAAPRGGVVPARVGDPCEGDDACAGEAGAVCLPPSAGWPGGACVVPSCTATSCPDGSTCFVSASGAARCVAACTPEGEPSCREGYACGAAGACLPAKCVDESCGPETTCDPEGGACLAKASVPAMTGPVPACTSLPPRDCNEDCAALLPFEPVKGRGYDNYPINGETEKDQYRSFARRDLILLVTYAAAYVDCKAKAWKGGNGAPLGLGDMSEKSGAIPGTRDGEPGHPKGTHTNGFDMDIAYFQTEGPNNRLRAVCSSKKDGREEYHCTAPPTTLDLPRTTLFLGALLTSPRVRVIGVDGQIGPLVEETMPRLCTAGFLPKVACDKLGALAYETTDEGRGWFQFHHHHLHVSLKPDAKRSAAPETDAPMSLVPGAPPVGLAGELLRLGGGRVLGHAHAR